MKPNDFAEWANLAANYEAFRFTKCRVRVHPQQNVSNNSSSVIGDWCIFPWHRKAPSTYTYNDFLSVDKCKTYRGTTTGRMTFVPSVLSYTQYADKLTSSEVNYRPRLEVIDKNVGEISHYTGCIGFQALTDAPENAKAHYNIIIDMYCTFINQKTIKNY